MAAVRVEVLSDHTGSQLQRSQQVLRKAEKALDTTHGRHQVAVGELRAARRSKAWWRRLLRVSSAQERAARSRVRTTRQEIAQAYHRRQQAYDRVGRQAAGAGAEDALEAGLSGLSDEWTMLRGYRNRRGETDHVLVGPRGVWAVEVKHRRVRLYVDGDDWWYHRLDSRGRPVGAEPAVDASGRTWARQVNDVAEDLAAWLRRNGHDTGVRTAVMLLHSGAQIGHCRSRSVAVVGTRPEHLLYAISSSAQGRLSQEECRRIVALIRRDHRHHEGRRGRSARGSGRPGPERRRAGRTGR